MPAISAVIITKNEERNIARCLESLAPVVDEIIVVDSGSTDSTEAICHRFGAIFTPHTWEGYSQQKNFANSLVSHPLTLSIDADEALSPALAQSILQLKNQPLLNAAYRLNRLTNFCGHWIHHDDVVTAVDVRGVTRLGLATKDKRHAGSETTKSEISRVNDNPLLVNSRFVKRNSFVALCVHCLDL